MSRHRLTIAAAVATMLAAISLYPLLTGLEWFFVGAGATIVAAGVGTLTRLRRLPVLVCLAAGALGLLLYLNLVFAARPSFVHLLPTPGSLRQLGQLAHAGFGETSKYAPPAPEVSGLVLLATGGIGIVALLTDLVAVRLRSVALAGIPLLLLVTEPFTVSASQDWVGTVITFCLASAGYLAMLGADSRQRIREWEETRPGAGAPDTSALSAAGRRVGMASLVVALCLPLLIPGLHDTRLFGGGPGIGGRPGSGGGGAGFPSPETAMSQQLQTGKAIRIMQYRTVGATPTVPLYFQLYALDSLAPAGFQLISTPEQFLSPDGQLPAPPGVSPALLPPAGGSDDASGNSATAGQEAGAPSDGWRDVDTAVTISSGVSATTLVDGRTATVLPVPYPALKASPPGGTWRASDTDLMMFSRDAEIGGQRYTVESADLSLDATATANLEVAPAPPAAISDQFTSLPSTFKEDSVLKNIALRATAGKATELDKAQALQSYLNSSGGFSYSTKAIPVASAAGLENFLTATKRGYCQQFAVAMAVLARYLGIPSRVAIGYTSGSAGTDGTWNITTHDAHEWPELYFTGYGWLRFEPTPTGTAGQGSATAPAYSKQAAGAVTGGGAPAVLPSPSSGASAGTTPKEVLPPEVSAGDPGASGDGLHRAAPGVSPWAIFGLVLAGLALIGLIAPSIARLAIRRRRWRRASRGGDGALAHAAWLELQDDLADYQAGRSPSESPRALGTRLGGRLAGPGAGRPRARADAGAGVAALDRITAAEERARYASRPVPGASLRKDSAEFRRALAATMPRRARWRARLLPLSVITPTASGVSRAADAMGGFSPRRLRRPGQPSRP
jgi:transglutaminase-like putative cysteine protease